jgi:uncharacterized damage-inducible protein DinB
MLYTVLTMQWPAEVLLTDVEYSFWANADLLRAITLIGRNELDMTLPISHGSLYKTVVHIYVGERVWLDFLRTPAAIGRWRRPADPVRSTNSRGGLVKLE